MELPKSKNKIDRLAVNRMAVDLCNDLQIQ